MFFTNTRLNQVLLLSFLYLFSLISCTAIQTTRKPASTALKPFGFDTVDVALPEIEVWPTDAYINEGTAQAGHDSTNTAPYQPEANRLFDLQHIKIEAEPQLPTRSLAGKATITLSPWFYPQDSLVLDAKWFEIAKVELVQSSGKNLPLAYTYPNKLALHIKLNKTYKRNEPITVYIEYKAFPEKLAEETAYYNYDNQGLYFINPDGKTPTLPTQIWTQGETESSSAWFPTIDKPNQRCTQELLLTVADKYTTISNGKKISSTPNPNGTRTDYWKQDLPHAPYLFAFAVGEFSETKDQWRNIPVNYYVEKPYGPYAKDIFGATPKMIEFYSNLLNYPYPWDKYHQVVVRNFVAGAMENTGCVLFYDAMLKSDRELLDENSEDIIAHELFHHWFGDLVTCESWANLPLNEAFATYGEYLWFEHAYGRDEADYRRMLDLTAYLIDNSTESKHLIRYYHKDREEMFDAHSYQKGGCVLHMLRKYLGDTAFFSGLNTYLKENAYQSVEIHNLRLAFEKVTGQDLNWFFDQWFLGKGHPEISLTNRYDEANNQTILTVSQTQSGKPFIFPVYIDVYTAPNKIKRDSVWITQRQSEFAYNGKPLLINFDAENALLCTLNEEKTPEQWAFQWKNAPLFADRFQALLEIINLQYTQPELISYIEEALNDPHWAIRIAAIDALTLTDNLNPEIENEGKNNNYIQARLDKIAQIAANDPTPNVRAAALNKLMDTERAASYESLFEKASTSRSNTVSQTG